MTLYQDGNIQESFNVYVDWEHSQFHNLVRNSSFNFFRSTGEVIDWQRTENNSGGSLSTFSPYNGLANYKIVGTGGATQGQLTQAVTNKVKRSVDYYLSAYVNLSAYTSGDVVIKLYSASEATAYATITVNSTTTGWERKTASFTAPSPVPDDLTLYIQSETFTGTVEIDAVCLEEQSSLGILPYTPFEVFRPVSGTTDYVAGTTEIESDTTGYEDVTSWVTEDGLEAIIETPESGKIVVNRGSLELFNGNLGISPKVFSAYSPSTGYFNGPDHGDGKGNVRSGRRVIVTVTAYDGTTTETHTIFSGTLETPKDLGLTRKIKFQLWGRSYTLEKNKLNFVRLNRANNLVRNSGFELWDTDEETLEVTNPQKWSTNFGSESVTLKAIKSVNFGVVAPELTGTGVGSSTISLRQQLQDANGDNLNLNGTYQVRARIKANNGTANPSIAGIKCTATSGSFTAGSSVSSYTPTTSGYVEVTTSFTTVGNVEVRVDLEGVTNATNAYEFSFDNVHVVQSYESSDYDTGISYVTKELLREVGFGSADFAVEDDFKIIEYFQVMNETPLKKLAELLQVGRHIYYENEYGQIVIKNYDTYIDNNPSYRTIELSHFKDGGFSVETLPAYNSVVIEADPVVAHDTFGKRIESGAVIGEQLSKTPTQRIKFEDIDEAFINHLTVGKLTATQIDATGITTEKLLTGGGSGNGKIDINITNQDRITFLDPATNELASMGTASKTGIYGSGNWILYVDTTATTGQNGIFAKVGSGDGYALLAETGDGTTVAGSNALVVRDDGTYSGVAIRALDTSIAGYSITSGNGVDIHTTAFTLSAPDGVAYGSTQPVMKAYCNSGSYSNFLYKAPSASKGFSVNNYGSGECMLSNNLVYSGSWSTISGSYACAMEFDSSNQNIYFWSYNGSFSYLGGFGFNYFAVRREMTLTRNAGNTYLTIGSTGQDTNGDGIHIASGHNRGISITGSSSSGIYISSVSSHGVDVASASGYGFKSVATGYGGAFEGAGGGVFAKGTGSSTGVTCIPVSGWGLFVGASSITVSTKIQKKVEIDGDLQTFSGFGQSGNATFAGTLSKGAGSCLTIDMFRLESDADLKDGMIITYSETAPSVYRSHNKPISFANPCSMDMDKRIAGVVTQGKEFVTADVDLTDEEWRAKFEKHCDDNGLVYSKILKDAYYGIDHFGNPQVQPNKDYAIVTSDWEEAFKAWMSDPDQNETFYAGVLGEYGTCLVDPSFGDIEVGDLICTSTTLGHGRKVKDEEKAQAIGCIVGKAITSRTAEEGCGPISIFIMLS
jgi:hypothetical protein